MSDDNVQVQFGASTGKAESGIDLIKSKLGELSEVATKAFEANQLIEFGEKIKELGDKVGEFAEKFAKMGEDVNRATQMLGLSAKEFQEFAFAVKLGGGEMDGAVQSMLRFERNIADAGRGAGDAVPFFRAVGVSLKDLRNGNVDEIMKKVADSFSKTADGVEKVAIANAIGGRSFAQMIPILNQGAAGLEKMNEQLKLTGDYLTALQKDNFDETDNKIDLMKASFEGLGITMFDAFRPAIDSIVEGITGLIQIINDAIKQGGNWQRVLQAIVLVFDTFILTIDTAIQTLRTLWEVGEIVITQLIGRFRALGSIMRNVLSGDFSNIEKDYAAYMQAIEAQTKKSVDNIARYWNGLADRANNMREGLRDMGDKSTPENKDKRPKLKLPGDTNTAKNAADEKLKSEADWYDTIEKLRLLDVQNERNALDEKVRMGQVSEQEKFSYLIAYANREAQIKADSIQRQLQLDNLTKSQKQKLYDQMLLLEKQHQLQIAQIQRQAQLAQMQRYQQVFQTINNSFKGMIQGILQGTQTWRQALANVFTNLLSSFVGMLEEMAMQWVEKQIMMAVFGQAESASIIGGHAAEGAAAAYASTAAIPIVGPSMAPAAAALAYGNIMAFSALPSFDVGAWSVNGNGAAMIHDKEMIIPAGPAQAFRNAMSGNSDNGSTSSGGGDGGIHLHFNGPVIDGKRWFMDNKNHIAAAMKAAQRGGDRHISNMMKA